MHVLRTDWFIFGSLELAAVALLSGCAVIRPTDAMRPVDTACPGTGAVSRAVSPAEAVPDQPLTLDAALARALACNPGVAAAAGDARAAAARQAEARGALFPTVSAEGAYARYLDDQRLVPARSSGEASVFTESIYSGDLVVRLPLFAGGKFVNELRAAELLRLAADRRLGRTREELVYNVTTVFYSLLAQERLIRSLMFSQEALAGHLARIDELLAAQKAARVDRLRTEVRLADVEQRRFQEENTLAVLGRVLAGLMGVAESGWVPKIDGILEDGAYEPQPLASAIMAAFANRKDYLAARNELEAQARRVDVARAGHSPVVNLFGAYGARWDAHTGHVPAGGGEWEDVGRAGIGVEIPLFEGGRVSARVEEERAKLAAAQARLREKELRIRVEVETAVGNHGAAAKRVRTLEKSVEQAKESLRIERQKYDVGKGAIVDVLDAQAALLEAETGHARALADLSTARAQIAFSVGKGVE